MSLNGVSGVSASNVRNNVNNSSQNTSKVDGAANKNTNQEAASKDVAAVETTPSAVYEKSNTSSKKRTEYKQDTATINQLKQDAERRTSQLRTLVEKLFLKQGQTFDESNMYQLLREGKVPVDAETAAQAKADIAEDGYWGVSQTSDRLVSFAKALTGGDPQKADEMIAAVKKGFEEATKTWGDELPDICKNTLDATMKKLDEWKNSLKDETE